MDADTLSCPPPLPFLLISILHSPTVLFSNEHVMLLWKKNESYFMLNVACGYRLILKAPVRIIRIAKAQVDTCIREDILDKRTEVTNSEYISHHGPVPSPSTLPSKRSGPHWLLIISFGSSVPLDALLSLPRTSFLWLFPTNCCLPLRQKV